MHKAKTFWFTAVMAACGLLSLNSGQARASYTVLLNPPVTASGSNFIYSYTASTSSNDQLTTGDYFRIYDFSGYKGVSGSLPAGWALSATNFIDPTPNVLLTHGDSSTIENLTLTYTGATTPGPVTIPGFNFLSSIGTQVVKDFYGQIVEATGPSPNTAFGGVLVPGVPEPSSMISGGIGVILLGFGYGYRSRRKMSA